MVVAPAGTVLIKLADAQNGNAERAVNSISVRISIPHWDMRKAASLFEVWHKKGQELHDPAGPTGRAGAHSQCGRVEGPGKRRAAGERASAGDASFRKKNAGGTKQFHERALVKAGPDAAWYLRLKLADVAYLLGDLEMERRLREAVYGNWRR